MWTAIHQHTHTNKHLLPTQGRKDRWEKKTPSPYTNYTLIRVCVCTPALQPWIVLSEVWQWAPQIFMQRESECVCSSRLACHREQKCWLNPLRCVSFSGAVWTCWRETTHPCLPPFCLQYISHMLLFCHRFHPKWGRPVKLSYWKNPITTLALFSCAFNLKLTQGYRPFNKSIFCSFK